MLRPSLEEVKALAKQYNTIPVFYEFSADNQTPLNIYRAFSQESRNSFILESVSNGVQWDRYSFVGFSPKEEIRITGNTAEIRSGEKSETFEVAHPIAFLKERMAAYHSPVLEGAPNFTGGLIGYFGYDTVRYMEKKLTNVPEDDIHMPDCHLFLYEELLAYDHLNSNGIVILNLHTDGDLGAQYAAAQWRAEELADIVRHYNPQPQERRHHGESVVRSNLTKEQYSQMVRDAKEYIKNGDIFQIVLSQRFEISNPPDSFSVYRKLRATNLSPYSPRRIRQPSPPGAYRATTAASALQVGTPASPRTRSRLDLPQPATPVSTRRTVRRDSAAMQSGISAGGGQQKRIARPVTGCRNSSFHAWSIWRGAAFSSAGESAGP